LESEGGGDVVDMDLDDDDILLEHVVIGGTAETEGDLASGSGSSESEEEEVDERMEERLEDPIIAVRNLLEKEEGVVREGMSLNDEEVAIPVIKPVLDNRYYAVRGLRKKSGQGKDWDEAGVAVEVERVSFLTPEDDWILFNSNHFSLEKKNISRSFDAEGIYVTCLSGPHNALAGKDGKPVVFCLADQHFSPAAPADDGRSVCGFCEWRTLP
jgi:hypothetical protein